MEPSKSTNILIVEDNADDSFMLVRQLEKAQIDDHITVNGWYKFGIDA